MGKIYTQLRRRLKRVQKKNQPDTNIKVGNFIKYSGLNKEMSPINIYQMCNVIEVIKRRNGDHQTRSLKV